MTSCFRHAARFLSWSPATLSLLAITSVAAGEPSATATQRVGGRATAPSACPPELLGVTKTTTIIEAFRPTPRFDRHDPSNVIRHEGRYWVFYTRNSGDHKDASVRVASSGDGYDWKDIGEAIGRGPRGDWDESGAIAPYVVHHKGKFYLFYTGFRGGDLATRELGCAIADRPAGPWTRWQGNPILRQDADPAAWDSGMLGDSNVIFRDGKWWLYYKSRRDKETNKDTRIGVAIADQITGPYRKHPANPLFAGHAFSAWRHRDGVAALCGEVSPKIKWSADGLHFGDAGEMPNQSTGLFCPDADADPDNRYGFDWGLEVYTEGGARGLRRFDCTPRKMLAAATREPEGAERRSNIIFILADDLGYGDIGPFGQQKIRTPHLDRLAAEGMCFDQFYPGAAVCAPTRCTLMTGLHTGHGRVRGNHGNAGLSRVPLRPQDFTVAEMLRSAGYATAAIGKWGLGEPNTTGLPNKKGFDFWFGYLNQDLAEDYFPEKIWRNDREIALPGNMGGKKSQYSNDLMTDEALAFIEANRSRPFFLYLAYTIPHAVWEVPADSLSEYAGRFDEPVADGKSSKVLATAPRATYAAMVTRLDRYVGRVLDKIRGLGLDDNTIVFFSSDNGAPQRAGISQFFGSNGSFRGNKGSLWEGGIHTPMIVRWPGRVPAGRRSAFPWAGWDFLPTAAALAGVTPPKDLDGISVLPALCGRPQSRDGYLYWETITKGKLSQAVRIGDLKAVRNDRAGPIEVYNLGRNPGETKNIAASEPAFVARVEEILQTARTKSEHWPVEMPADTRE